MGAESVHRDPQTRPRRRRSDGDRSRTAILREAAKLATVEGLGGLSIARLAEAVGMSKSGLFAHFGSKEELQLATIETATTVFSEQIFEPAARGASGLERLGLLIEGFLQHVERGVYPGGCFFAAVGTEMAARPGPVRDRAVGVMAEMLRLLEVAVRDAQAEGDLDPAENVEQLAFELDAFMYLANAQFVLAGNAAPIERARRAVAARLALAAPAAA